MADAHPNPTSDDVDARLTRLEELAGFTEHHAEQLSGQLAALFSTVDALTRRLAALETRLSGLAERTDRGFDTIAERLTTDPGSAEPTDERDDQIRADRPPHWGGPTG